jgi:hypothetical protein
MTMKPWKGGERSSLAALCLLGCALLAGATPARAQSQKSEDKDEAFEKVDPYTRGEAPALEKAGYLSFGPFPFAENIKTADIEEALGGQRILWVETAHFKLGSTLRSYKFKGDPREDKKLDDELKRLKTKFANFRPPKGKLDPWLRLHLYAMRLEEQYAEFEKSFGITDDDFDPKKKKDDVFMGEGPYLGMPLKFTVLICEKQSGTSRFAKRFLDAELSNWQRAYLPGGSEFLGISMEALKTYSYDNDAALHATIASEMTANLLESFRKIGLWMPLWFKAGLGHYYARNVDERYTLSATGTFHDKNDEQAWRWEPRVYGLVFNKAAKPWKDTLAWSKWDDLKAQGHLICWSRVSWMLARKDTDLHAFLMGISESLTDVPEPDRARVCAERQEGAFKAGFGKSVEDVDAEWKHFVVRMYEKK